jgi:transposase
MTGEGQELRPARRRRSFSAEFKPDTVALLRDESRTLAHVVRSLGVGDGTLGNWVRQDRTGQGEKSGLTTREWTEMGELRREHTRLRMDRKLLKRATGFAGVGIGTVTRYVWVAAR